MLNELFFICYFLRLSKSNPVNEGPSSLFYVFLLYPVYSPTCVDLTKFGGVIHKNKKTIKSNETTQGYVYCVCTFFEFRL